MKLDKVKLERLIHQVSSVFAPGLTVVTAQKRSSAKRLELQGVHLVVLGQRELGVQVSLEERLGLNLLEESGVHGLLVLLALLRDDRGL